MSLLKSLGTKNLILVILVTFFMGLIIWQWVISKPFADVGSESNALTQIEKDTEDELDDLKDSIAKGTEEAKIIKDEVDKQLKQAQLIEEAKKYLEEKENSNLKIPDNEIDCEEQAGEWAIWGENIEEMCNLFTTDADKECGDSSECESICIVDLPEIALKDLPIEVSGNCAARSIVPGCYSTVVEGFVYGVSCD